MTKKLFFALVLFAFGGLRQPLLAAVTGAGKSSQTDSKSTASQKTLSDGQIEQAIRVKLAKSKMSADHFTVSVVKGVATIEGSTSVIQHKGAMTRMAKACGATTVRNNIHISDEAKEKLAQSSGKFLPASAGASGGKSTRQNAATGASGSATIPRAVVLRQNASH